MAASCSAQRPNGYGDDDSDEWKRSLPPGHGFYPTDQELITEYLKHKAQNLKIHAGIINDLDIYNYHPEELEAANALNNWNGRRYFFTAFKRKTKDGTRGDRAVGGGKGYWKASQAREPLKDGGGVVIGTKQPLVFHDAEGKKTSWLMSEFRYPANVDPFPLYNQTEHELALCVIYYHGERKIVGDNQESKINNTNSMENLQSPHLIPTPCANPNFASTSTMQNPNHTPYPTLNPNFNATSTLQCPNRPPSPAQNSNFITISSPYPTQNPNFNATSPLQSNNHPPLPCQNSNNFIATSSLYPTQNLNFNSTSALQSPNHPPSPTQIYNFITTSSLYSTQNPSLNATFALQNPNHSPPLTQNSNFIPTSSMQNLNHSLSFAQNPNFIETSSLRNSNHPLSSSQNPNFIATSSQQNPTFPQYSLAQNSFLQDAWNWNNELPAPLFIDEEIHQYFNDDGIGDTFQLRVLSYDSDDTDESSSRKKRIKKKKVLNKTK